MAKRKKINIKKIIESPEFITITTVEIAEITGKRHDHVLRDAREMIETLETAPKVGDCFGKFTYAETTYKGKGRGARKLPMIVLGEDLVITLLSGYSVQLRYALVVELRQRREAMEGWLKAKETRRSLAAGYAPLTDALQQARLEAGKSDPPYIYSNEADMINRIVLGMSAKQYREQYGVLDVRGHITEAERNLMTKAQRLDAALVELGYEYKQRKEILATKHEAFKERYFKPLQEALA